MRHVELAEAEKIERNPIYSQIIAGRQRDIRREGLGFAYEIVFAERI